MRFRFAALTFALTSVAGHVWAALCADLRPAPGPIGYRARSAPERCEGFYQSLVAGESIELLSFVRHPIVFDPRADKLLTIVVPGTQALGGKPVAVVARALPLRTYYRMDAQVTSGGSLPWPIAEVVVPAGLASGDLGVVGTVRSPNGPVFVPLDVTSFRTTVITVGPPVIIFRSPTDLDSFQWRLYLSGSPPPWKQAAQGRTLRTGDPIPLSLDGPPGSVLTLDVAAKPVGSDYIRTRVQILLP